MMGIISVLGVLAAAGGSGLPAAAATEARTLLADDFRDLAPGMLSPGVIGAQVEYHYLPLIAPKGNWVVSNFRSEGSQRAWRVVEHAGRRALAQTDTALAHDVANMHLMVVAGDERWTDYEVETSFTPGPKEGLVGVAFFYQHDRAYYLAGVRGATAVLIRVQGGRAFRVLDETVLAEAPFAWRAGEEIAVRITAGTVSGAEGEVKPANLRVRIGDVELTAHDPTFRAGKIAFTADVPAHFGPVRVSCAPATAERIAAARAAAEAEEARLQAAHPQPVLWRKLATPAFGTGRNVRFGDLNGDGRSDILIGQMRHHGPTDSHSEIGCLTALDLDGELLWQVGTTDRWQTVLTNDVVFQIHDLDADGKNEVVYGRGFELIVADGATGKTKFQAPMPETPRDPLGRPAQFPRILGDCVAFADLRGTGARRDLILKDRYRNVWAFDDRLQPLWTAALNTGHFPYPKDLDGDGREEVTIGYSVLEADGRTRWTNEPTIKDHADGVAWVSLQPGAPPVLVTAASDEGLFFADTRGRILRHLQLGHVQNVSVADFRPDLPGLELVTINFWSNQGIVHLLNSAMDVYHVFEPAQHGSMVQPVNWTGRPGELWCLSTNSAEGGLFDGWGRRVVRFPADGHPDYCSAVLDVTGDARDEIITWDGYEMWIYTPDGAPPAEGVYRPRRNPQHNQSNYMVHLSLPAWAQ